ncbi:hypothetical protein ABW20_dc0109417 [Dactylellina cionopaga]|nr:hypothetical protein ABW20_dc0109417 [Dactylellina cionopaga]
MVDDPYVYDACFAEQKHVYSSINPYYAFDQTTFPKLSLPYEDNRSYPGCLGNISYTDWNLTPDDAIEYCFNNQQMLQEAYYDGVHFDSIGATYMSGHHAIEYQFGMNTQEPSGICPDLDPSSPIYMSPCCDLTYCNHYSQTAWSPSEPSVASLSPPYDNCWNQTDSTQDMPERKHQEEEILQGLGLYDCPELIVEDDPFRALGAERFGKGLKLEESFMLEDGYLVDKDGHGSLA